MGAFTAIVEKINLYLSDYVLVLVLISGGIYFTIKTNFVQVRCFGKAISNTFRGFSIKNKSSSGGISSFQALMTSVGAQVGTGNIIGVCSAILAGGPGAVFWIWVIAFFGMATAYSEAVLAQDTRFIAPDLSVHGGPVCYIKKAFPGAFGSILSRFFALAVVLALGFMGCMVQSGSIVSVVNNAFGIPKILLGVLLALCCSRIFLGGIGTVASLAEKLVPFMAVFYITGCVFLLIFKIKQVPEALGMIFYGAFRPDAIIGGSIGYALKTAVSQGVKRGLFSNEAGMGSTPHAHALADADSPHEQGLAAMIGLFIDTFVVLSLTALVAVCFFYTGDTSLSGIDKNNMIQSAFSLAMGHKVGSAFVALCLFFFAFSSVISWNYFGRMNFEFLFGVKGVKAYISISCVFVFLGSFLSPELIWSLADLFNQLMVIPNMLSLVALSGTVSRSAKGK